ncbi:MAG TPA: hypothetical protein VFE52_07430, partial [Devosia sp.]|nr:hypothetical protein [Devosia sp.]
KRLANARAALSTAQTAIVAVCEAIDASDGWATLRIKFFDRRREIDKPLQANKYGGTTTTGGVNTADGGADLKGVPKPLCFGRVTNMVPVLANQFDDIYQVHDGAVVSITAYDGGVQLGSAGDYPTIAALRAASVPPGRIGTCLALGLFRPGTHKGQFVLTADVVEGGTAFQRTAAMIVQRMLARMGITGGANLNMSTFNGLATAAPQEVGIFVDGETTGYSAMQQVLDSIGGYIVPNAMSVYELGRLSVPGTPVGIIELDGILSEDGMLGLTQNPDTDGNLPASRIVLQYAKNWHVHGESEIGGCAASRQAFLRTEYRTAQAQNLTTLVKHPLAPEMKIQTLLVSEADAVAEAARRLTLYGVRRDVAVVQIPMEDAAAYVLNSTATLRLPRLGYQAGRNMVVIGRLDNFADETVELTLWG